MGKKSGKRNGELEQLTAKVEKLRARLKRAKAGKARWKAEAKRLEAEVTKQAKQVKKLRKARAKSRDVASHPSAGADAKAAAAVPVPDSSWTVARLRASAREAGVVGYSRMTKAALLKALTRG